MTTAIAAKERELTAIPPLAYSITDAALATLRQELSGLRADLSPEDYERTRQGIGKCREWRGIVDKDHKAEKKLPLEWGRRIDAEKNRLIAAIEAIEEPLKASKQLVDDERNREKNAAKQAEIDRLEAERAAEEHRLKLEREEFEEKKRIFESQQAEATRLARETQQRVEAEQREAQRKIAEAQAAIAAAQDAERKRLEDERRKVEEERQAYARKAKAEQDERERAEQARLAAEAEARRVEEMRPDVERIHALADFFRHGPLPQVKSPEAVAFMVRVREYLEKLATKCEAFR